VQHYSDLRHRPQSREARLWLVKFKATQHEMCRPSYSPLPRRTPFPNPRCCRVTNCSLMCDMQQYAAGPWYTILPTDPLYLKVIGQQVEWSFLDTKAINSFYCDCNMTAHVGPTCTQGLTPPPINNSTSHHDNVTVVDEFFIKCLEIIGLGMRTSR